MCNCLQRPEEGISSPRAGVPRGGVSPNEGPRLSLGSLQAQYMLLTTSHFASPKQRVDSQAVVELNPGQVNKRQRIY